MPDGHVILIVEDDADLRECMCMILELEGYRPVGARDGLEALRYLGANAPPCAILLDLMMPVMDGGEFRRRQLADPRLAEVPTLVLSAMDTDVQESHVEGAAGYLVKPVAPEELARAVRELCPLAAA